MAEERIEDYLPFVKSIIAPYRNSGLPQEDLLQEGLIGLWEAMQRFEPERNLKLTTYAVYWIKKRIFEAIRREKLDSLDSCELNEEITGGGEPSAAESFPEKISLPEEMPLQEKRVLMLSFNEQLTLNEIADKLEIRREKVRQLKEKGLRRMKALLTGNSGL